MKVRQIRSPRIGDVAMMPPIVASGMIVLPPDLPALAVSADRQTESLRQPFLMTHCASPGDVRLIFAGHSHCHAICRALISPAEAGETTDPKVLSLAHGLAGLMGIGQGVDMRGLLVGLAQRHDIAVVWRGNSTMATFC